MGAQSADPGRAVSPALAALASASLRGVRAFGPDAGTPLLRVGRDPEAPWVCSRISLQARIDGFDLHAAVTVPAGNTEAREGLCRYLLRPAVAQDRLELGSDGKVQLELKTPWRDGTTHVSFEPLELLGRLATLIPRPRKNTLIYHGVLAANARWRSEVVARAGRSAPSEPSAQPQTPAQPASRHDARATSQHAPSSVYKQAQRHQRWADLMRRAFGIDVLECPNCFGRLRLIATIESPVAVRAILSHLGLSTESRQLSPARAPPQLDFGHADDAVYGVDAPDCWH